MRKHSFLYTAGFMLLGALLVIASVSFTMTFLSGSLEEKNSPHVVESALDYDSSSVIQILGSGLVTASGQKDVTISERLDETISNYNTSVYHQITSASLSYGQYLAGQCIEAGFTAVGLANARTRLFGKDGVVKAMDYWNNQSILSEGINISTDEQNINRPFEVNGIRIVYLSFTDVLNDSLPDHEQYLVNVYDEERTPEIVSEARSSADVVIVSMYWQKGNDDLPSERQKEIATKLADSGASIIFGNTGNGIQPVEWIDDTLVFYSMGNFITDSTNENEQLGILGAVTITKHTVYDSKRIELTNPKVDFVYSSDDTNEIYVDAYEESETSNSIQAIYESNKQILHLLDDSIRIGGIQ